MHKVDRKRFRKQVLGFFTGQEFDIRRVDIRDYMRELGLLPIETPKSIVEELKSVGEQMKARSGEPDFEDKSLTFFLRMGVVSPKIWFGDEEQCPEDQVCYGDLGTDRQMLANAVATFSFDLGSLGELESFFRRGGPGDPGPGGPEVRETANGDSPAGSDPEGSGAVVQPERGPESDPGGEESRAGIESGTDNKSPAGPDTGGNG